MEKLSIYVVEDDESIRTMVVYALNGSGYEAQGFPGGRSFYAAVNEKKPDLVLLDIMLPERTVCLSSSICARRRRPVRCRLSC